MQVPNALQSLTHSGVKDADFHLQGGELGMRLPRGGSLFVHHLTPAWRAPQDLLVKKTKGNPRINLPFSQFPRQQLTQEHPCGGFQ